MIKIKIHNEQVVAVADSELIGKKFSEGKLQLDIHKVFYDGDEFEEEEAEDMIKKMLMKNVSFNFVGHRAINIAVKLQIIDKQNILKIKGVPHSISIV